MFFAGTLGSFAPYSQLTANAPARNQAAPQGYLGAVNHRDLPERAAPVTPPGNAVAVGSASGGHANPFIASPDLVKGARPPSGARE
jgi:hypothetical protein